MMKRFYAPLCLLLTASLFLFSCCSDDDCPDAENTIEEFAADELTKVPYSGYDTLTFLDQQGDTHIVVGTGKQFDYNREIISGARHPDCPQNKTRTSQTYQITFTPIKGSLVFSCIQQKRGKYIILKKYPSVNFSIEYNLIGIDLTYDDEFFYDSIHINHQTFFKVRRAVSVLTSNNVDQDTSYSCYYNQSYGVLRIKSSKDNEDYSILK